jgi:hypothetical protein
VNFCETCKFRDEDFYCTNEKLSENYGLKNDDMLVYDFIEGGEFWVGAKFGCVHHEAKGEKE